MNQYEPSKEEIKAIQNNDENYFDGKYSEKQKQGFLRDSVARGKLNIIKFFMEQGVELSPEVYGNCIDSLVQKNKKVRVLEYLHSRGVDMTPENTMGLMRAAIALSVENTQYLAQFVPYDHNGIYLTLNCIVKRDNFSEKKLPLVKYEPILNILLQKCSSELLKKIMDIKGQSSKDEENNKYIFNLHLALQLPDDIKNTKKIKI